MHLVLQVLQKMLVDRQNAKVLLGFAQLCSVLLGFARLSSILLGHIVVALPNTVSTLFVIFGPRQNFCAFHTVPSIFQVTYLTLLTSYLYKL